MPIYVYVCQECGEYFEKLVSMSQGSMPQTCPSCGSKDSKKTIAAPAALSTGGGGGGCSSRGPFT